MRLSSYQSEEEWVGAVAKMGKSLYKAFLWQDITIKNLLGN